jgi:organic radical activating enzyme
VPITNEILGFDPKHYTNETGGIKSIPLIRMGCDSLYAHDKRFEHLWFSGDEEKLAIELWNLLPDNPNHHRSWVHQTTGLPYILSLTGGEPTLYQTTIPYLLNHHLLDTVQIILIETNCSVPIRSEFIDNLNTWIDNGDNRLVVWSNSPKLSASGEDPKKAIRPEVAQAQRLVKNYKQYFKFVVGPREEDFAEVEQVMNQYANKIGPQNIVGVMPECCTAEQQNEVSAQVAEMCIQRGYIYVSRLQNYLWGNGVGT